MSVDTTDNDGNKKRERKRVAVLFSGRGSNMASLIKAAMAPDYPAIITHAITNVPDAAGLKVAESNNITSSVVDHQTFDSREAHEEAVAAEIKSSGADLVCLAGYMRVLSEGFVRQFRGKILNIHPSLLPAYKGIDTHHRARLDGVKIHGASVHFVDESVDGGPLIAQVAVPVLPEDDDDDLAERVLAAEHKLYPHALSLVASGAVRMSGSRIAVNNSSVGDTPEPLFSPPIRGS